MRAIVLSGGGSKGAYQIGVWKALRKLNLNYEVVTGTSVGALNAALMVQNNYYKALYFWRKLSFSDVVDEKIDKNITKKELYKKYLSAVMNGGMKTNNLKKTVSKAISIKKIYNSPIDIGIVTVKSKGLKPILLRKKEIKKDQLYDYLVASASCFPAFSKKKIGDSEYIDGGLYDNLPINLAIDMGATEVIAVDLDEVGIKRKVKNKEIPITYISPNNDIGSFLIFNRKMAKRAMRIGYNDAMKKFKELDGNVYTFKKGEIRDSYLKYYDEFKNEVEKIIENKMFEIGVYKKIMNSQDWYQDYFKMLEHLAKIFELDDSLIYNIPKFNKMLIKKFEDTSEIIDVQGFIKEADLTKLVNKRLIVKKLYFYKKEKLASLFPREYLMTIYLKLIIGNTIVY